ncbi:hypothetical protein HPNQ4099_0945 [Helicobacter pylori NQ4099]|uniref:Uncharacterized protein n=1 Tax=Helicobacter pylori NQ4099 TaxID=992026 RepID=J0IUQ8_HELPX|nr:hypothetical protein HPNQ4099_0945 [Helicobacter pylori NQ4099]
MARHTAPRKMLKSLNPFYEEALCLLALKAWVNLTQANFLQS